LSWWLSQHLQKYGLPNAKLWERVLSLPNVISPFINQAPKLDAALDVKRKKPRDGGKGE